jgi:hypothetical protein
VSSNGIAIVWCPLMHACVSKDSLLSGAKFVLSVAGVGPDLVPNCGRIVSTLPTKFRCGGGRISVLLLTTIYYFSSVLSSNIF